MGPDTGEEAAPMADGWKVEIENHSLSRHVRTTGQLGRIVELTAYADIVEVMRSHGFEVLTPADRIGTDLAAPITGDSLVCLRGKDHFDRRRIESALFRVGTMKHYEHDFMMPRITAALDALRTEAVPVRSDLKEIAEEVLRSVVAQLIGLDGIDTPEGAERFGAYYQDLDNAVRIKWAKSDPEILAQRGQAALTAMITELIEPSWARRAELLASSTDEFSGPDDLITLMIQNREHYERWDRGAIAREIALFITASITTLTNQVCYAFQHIEEWIADHPEDAGGRENGEFLTAGLRESIRLHAGPILFRVANSDCTLAGGTPVMAGDVVWLNIRAASSDPDVYGADAPDFNPLRRTPHGALDHGLMFGVGRHTCIGKRFALGDDPDDRNSLQGAGLIILREVYRAGARLDPDNKRRFVPELLDVHDSLPIILIA